MVSHRNCDTSQVSSGMIRKGSEEKFSFVVLQKVGSGDGVTMSGSPGELRIRGRLQMGYPIVPLMYP